MNIFTTIWFWLLIISIIGFIVTVISFETLGQTSSTSNSTPVWVWIIFAISVAFFILAFILYAIDLSAYYYDMEIAEACGELPPPPPKKKIECPKRECVEKRIIECVDRKRPTCGGTSNIQVSTPIHVIPVQPINEVELPRENRPNNIIAIQQPFTTNTVTQSIPINVNNRQMYVEQLPLVNPPDINASEQLLPITNDQEFSIGRVSETYTGGLKPLERLGPLTPITPI
jgi:hypothetical protein